MRIDCIVKRLQTDQKLRKYTIKAIVTEAGFNSAEVFAKTFRKRIGIYPSYFIKKLENYKIIVGGTKAGIIEIPLKTDKIKECITSTLTDPIGEV